MISFTDKEGNDISLGYDNTIYARHNKEVIAICPGQDYKEEYIGTCNPSNWDDWIVNIKEISEINQLHFQYSLANIWTANKLGTRFLPKNLLF